MTRKDRNMPETPAASSVTFDRVQFLREHQRLAAAWNEQLPAWDAEIALRADAALAGKAVAATDDALCPHRPLDFLAAAYQATGDERYAAAARALLEPDLARAAEMRTHNGTLAISFVVGNTHSPGWLGTLPVFLGSRGFDDTLAGRVVAAAAPLLDFMMDHACQESMNWRIAQADSLLLNGLRLRFLPGSERWRQFGVAALNDAAHRQYLPDGVHIERNPHYHTWPLWMLSVWQQVGQAWPDLGLAFDVQKLARAWDYALGGTRPNGDQNGIHDSNAIRTGRTRNRAAELRRAFRRRNGLAAELPPPHQWFPDAGHAFLRDGWGEDATYLTFDATRWGTDHAHFSRNTVQVHAYGRTLLCETGWLTDTGTYSPKPMGQYSKATRSHNTLNLNGWNQCRVDPVGSRCQHCDGYDFVCSDYAGGYYPGEAVYSYLTPMGRGIWASHHRALLWIHGRAIVVIDSLYRQRLAAPETDADIPSLESNWQFSEGGAGLNIDEQAKRLTTAYADANVLMLFPLLPEGTEWTVREGQHEPVRGWVNGPVFQPGIVPAPQLTQRLPRMHDQWAELTTVIIPYRGAACPRVTAEAKATAPDNVGRLVLRWDDGTTDTVEWFYRFGLMLGTKVPGYDTDASLVHRCLAPDGALRQGAALDATYVKPYTRTVLPAPAFIRLA